MTGRVYYPRCVVQLDVLLEDWRDGSTGEVHELVFIPRSVEIERNDHRSADTFRVELAFADLPLDPRALRQARVRVWLGDVLEPERALPRARRKEAFVGVVDEVELALSNDEEVVRMSGRDLTGLFLDAPWPRGETVNVTRPLELVLNGLLGYVPASSGLRLSFTEGAAGVVLAGVIGRQRWAPGGGSDSVWDVIADVCGAAGLIAVIELDTLAVRRPGEVGRAAVQLTYGENVSKLGLKRNATAAREKQVRLVAWDEEARTSREATWPREPVVLRKRVGADGKVKAEAAPVTSFNVDGAYSTAELEEMARRIYEAGAREQVEGALETREMLDSGSATLVRLGNGDKLTVTVARSELHRVAGLSDDDAFEVLTRRAPAMDPSLVDLLLEARRTAERVVTSFYVKSARHKWSAQEGYTLSVSFINFVGGGGASGQRA